MAKHLRLRHLSCQFREVIAFQRLPENTRMSGGFSTRQILRLLPGYVKKRTQKPHASSEKMRQWIRV